MVDFEVCFGSLSCWNMKPLFNFNIWTDIWTLASRISWYLVESILPVLLYKDFTKTPFSPNITSLAVAKKFHFGFVSPKHIVPKGLMLLKSLFFFAYFRCFILCHRCSFWQHCHLGLYCLKYVVLLSCEQLDLCLLLFFEAVLHWCVGSSEHFSPGSSHSIWNLSWSSRPCLDCSITVHFSNVSDSGNRSFETLRESLSSLLLLGGNEPSSFWNPWTTVQRNPWLLTPDRTGHCSWIL